jgi:AcrR family transcriptional regulator
MPDDPKNNNSSSNSPFNRTAQHDAKRAAILSEAARLFNSQGSRATTLKDIAESLGLTKTSLYYYVKTKEELIYQCYMAALAQHHSDLDAIAARYDSAAERASAVLLQFFETWTAAQEGRGPHIAALLEIASLKGPHRKEVEQQYIRMFVRLRQHLRDGIAAGTIRDCHTNSATRAIMGSMEWLFFWLHKVPRDEVKEMSLQALDILSHGLSAGSDTLTPSPLAIDEGSLIDAPSGFDREQQNRRKQEAFYKTGTLFFNKQGFNGTSLDEIAEHLHVSKGAFYYHIKNKEDLLYNCYTNSMDITERIYQQVADSDRSGLQKIEQSCRQIFHVQNSALGPLIRYNTITALPPKRRREILARSDELNKIFGEFIEAGIADGSIRPINSFVAVNLITGAVNAAMHIRQWRKVEDIDEAGSDYFDIFFNGLTPR